MGSSDCFSITSEPQDIGKWFSNYVYESPELNSVKDFKDSSESVVPEIEERGEAKNENFEENNLLKTRDDLLVEVKGISNGIVKCKNLAKDNSSSKVLEYADSLSIISEPPDVKNWFSSYVYESPALDTSYEFRSDSEEDNVNEGRNDATICSIENKVDLSNSVRTDRRNELEGQTGTSGGLVECVNFVGQEGSQLPNFPKISQMVCVNGKSSQLNDLMTKCISHQVLHKKIMQDHGIGSEKGFEGSILCAGSSDDNSFSKEASQLDSNRTYGKQTKSPKGSIHRRYLTEDRMTVKDCRKDIHVVLPAENFGFNMTDEKPVKKATCINEDKENDRNEFAENGFVSTRKSRSKQFDDGNSFKRPLGVKSHSSKNGLMVPPNGNKEAATDRKVLLETTNSQLPNAVEISGKWRCPQKSKPNLGPPMKQLRLEQWVRRV